MHWPLLRARLVIHLNAFQLHHLGLPPCSCCSHIARHKIQPHRISVGINFPVQQEEAVTAGKGALSRLLTETCHVASKCQAHSNLQASGTNARKNAAHMSAPPPRPRLTMEPRSLWNRAVADNGGLLPAARLFTIYFENMLLLPQEAPHLKAVEVWEMGRNKMGAK